MTRAVVFDLWDTLAAWPQEDMTPVLAAAGLTLDEWMSTDHRDKRWTGSFDAYFEWAGLDLESARQAGELRLAVTRRALAPVAGALETLAELRARGLRLGLISNCSGDVVELWEESAFGGLFDAVVLSADVALCKPDPRIYRMALDRLDVDPAEAIFVGDGHSDELAGAEAVGMRAVQVGSLRPWTGEQITDLGGVLELV